MLGSRQKRIRIFIDTIGDMKTRKRKDGFYWVSLNGTWKVMEWVDRYFYSAGSDWGYDDSELTEIGERVLQEKQDPSR